MSKTDLVILSFDTFKELQDILNQLADYEGQIIVADSKPDHEKKHLVRHAVTHNVYLPVAKGSDTTEIINKYLQNVQRKWILIMDGEAELPRVDEFDKISLYDAGLFRTREK